MRDLPVIDCSIPVESAFTLSQIKTQITKLSLLFQNVLFTGNYFWIFTKELTIVKLRYLSNV